MKKKSIRRLAPCSGMDIERLESWLSDMAAKGWHLVSTLPTWNLFKFEEGEPKVVRYRLEPGKRWDDDDKPEHTAQELFKDCGWESVTSFGRFFIFRALSPDAPELNTDMVLHLETMKKLRRKSVLGYLFLLAFLVIMGAIYVDQLGYQLMIVYGLWFSLFVVVVFLLAMAGAVIEILQANRFVRRLKNNVPLDHNKPWHKGAWYYRMVTVFGMAFYLLWILLCLTRCGNLVIQTERSISDYQGKPPIVTAAELSPEGTYIAEDWGNFNTVTEHRSSAGYVLEWHEYGQIIFPDGSVTKGVFWVDYYETTEPWIARGLVAELWRDVQREGHYTQLESPQIGADFVVIYTHVGGPHILIQHGNIVIRAWTGIELDGENAIYLWAEKMMEKLK